MALQDSTSSIAEGTTNHSDDLEPGHKTPRHPTRRNQAFRPGKEPFLHLHQLRARQSRVNGPFSSLNPTSVHYEIKHDGLGGDDGGEKATAFPSNHRAVAAAPGVNYKWTSRNNRKGRHAIAIDPSAASQPNNPAAPGTPADPSSPDLPRPSSSAHEILRGIKRMATHYPVWDVSYLVATVFTLGSVIWVVNAFFVYLPLQDPASEFGNEILYGGGITAFVGATVFEIGSFLLMAEAVNENRTGCFGWAVEEALGEEFGIRLRPAARGACSHHHANRRNLVGKPAPAPAPAGESGDTDGKRAGDAQHEADARAWVWCPSWHELTTHYSHELGFLACFAQLCGASIFWIAGFTALPGIYNHLSPGLIDGVYWAPQVVGGCGFIISGTLFMIETQARWYLPAPKALGWHIGLWNLIGGIGFTMSPAFGYDTRSWAQYQAALSTFWGSWAFLIGSVVQWYESLDKHPVEKEDLGS